MTHAWIPLWEFFLGLNGVSWTISVEMFFYLVFPLFLASWGKYERVKLVVAALPASVAGDAGAHWINVNGFTPAFVFLVYVFASSTGPVARMVGSRPVVLLGEISFSLYKVHTIVLSLFERFPNTVQSLVAAPMLAYWLVSILTAYCMWYFIETPFRRAIVKYYEGRPENMQRIAGYVRTYGPTALLFGLFGFFGAVLVNPRPEVQLVAPMELIGIQFRPESPVVFGDRIELLGG